MKTVYLSLTITLSLFVTTALQAQLKWEQTTVEVAPPIGAKEAVGHFKYENTGDKPVHFKSVKTSCGCTVAQSQKDQVAPGEKGEITATLKVGDRTGPQVKTVTVETDDTAKAVMVLTLKANIAQVLDLQPNFVYWQVGEDAKPKTIAARAGKDIPIKNLEVVSANPDFLVEVQKGSAAGEFRINIRPKDTAKPGFAAITVKPDFPKDAPKPLYVMARVTPAPASAAAH
ncbi:MAG: hypothetical protein JWO45_1070 [Spartobacteria bacterium]|nr:hypothetical protein [Spartobacteria bacterium]